ncbi:8-oxoguanine deaminase [Chelatococcus sambhunathii]|uniref:8-oxoguanine deaminase n=1 Tax=Chelatococcus sambhunathii TaxID=363953 RepID=A0ABU1DD47_9HYPH|nr:8-oxoguanine deaminase [Chelatococcus sambhunathii]MDR4306022.1 8-oxoguanine deaminase [Chelatococcus sambhunathii]
MSTLLIRHADVLVTMDETRREIPDGALFARDGVIEQVGATSELPEIADLVLDMTGRVVIPGLVNTHHHLYQNLTRVVPAAQDALLFGWLKTLYPIWGRMGPEHIRVSTLVGLMELLETGCTTSSDHLYMFPNGARLDDSIEAAVEIGVRFHPTRGSMSIGESKGGLPPDALVEDEDAILADCRRVIETFHDPAPFSMVRVGVAPCSPFSVSRELMRDSAELARSYGVGLHTHLAENVEDVAYSLATFGARPGAYAEELGWCGPDVWHAHCVQLDAQEIGLFARTGTSVAHCPCSNMRLGSGIAPVREMMAAGVKVGLGVDGSASNDSGHMLNEARQALLLQRVAKGGDALTARQALELATLGGASALGRDDIGALAPGKAADLAAFDMRDVAFSGAQWDPVAALVFCGPGRADLVVVNGRVAVERGRCVTVDRELTLERHALLARQLMDGAN